MRSSRNLFGTPLAVAPLTLLALATVVSGGGCDGTQKPTQIVAGVTTQLLVPRDIKSIGLVVQFDGKLHLCTSFPVRNGRVDISDGALIPFTSGLIKEQTKSAITVTILGFRYNATDFETTCLTTGRLPQVGEGGVAIFNRARVPYVDSRVISLLLKLSIMCRGVKCEDEALTCVAGECIPADIDPTTLPDYSPDHFNPDSSTCFPAFTCMQDNIAAQGGIPVRAAIPNVPGGIRLKEVDATNCIFESELPAAAATGSFNVRATFGDTLEQEILDFGQPDGFSIPSGAGSAQRFQLAPGVCKLYSAGKIVRLEATKSCPQSKGAYQSICRSDLDRILSGEYLGLEPDECSLGKLDAAPRGIVLLLPRAPSFRVKVESGELDALFGAFKDASYLKATLAGSMQYPSPGAETCGSQATAMTTLAAPAHTSFRRLSAFQTALTTSLQQPQDSAATRFLNVALASAAAAPGQTGAFESGQRVAFDRYDVFVVAQELGTTCANGQTIEEAAALLDGTASVHGIAVGFANNNPPVDPEVLRPIVSSDGALVDYTASGDAAKEQAALRRVAEVIATGTCYLKTKASPADLKRLQFLDSASGVPSFITRNDACTPATQATGSGFGVTADGKVTVCGDDCARLRTALVLPVSDPQNPPPKAWELPVVGLGTCPPDGP
jgi:hypothetical protein